MTVYVVIRGEKHQGANVLGVYKSFEKAELKLLEQTPHFSESWQRKSRGFYVSGIDYLEILTLDLED